MLLSSRDRMPVHAGGVGDYWFGASVWGVLGLIWRWWWGAEGGLHGLGNEVRDGLDWTGLGL